MRSLATLVVGSYVLLAAGWAGAAPLPTPPPKFWTTSGCQQVLHTHDDGGLTAEGYGFHIGLAICVGTGGPRTCTWTPGHHSRLYSEFTVFSRARYIGGIVRSFTLATRAGDGFVRTVFSPRRRVDYYMSPASVRLLFPSSTPASFRSIVAPIVARLKQHENGAGCEMTP